MNQSKTLFTTGMGKKEEFDTIRLILSERQVIELIHYLSHGISNQDAIRYGFTLYGMLHDGEEPISLVEEVK